MITSGGNRNPLKLDLDADTRAGRRRISTACPRWPSVYATAPILLLDRGHAEKILHTYAQHFNNHRPHQGRDQLAPNDDPPITPLPHPESNATTPSPASSTSTAERLITHKAKVRAGESILKHYGRCLRKPDGAYFDPNHPTVRLERG